MAAPASTLRERLALRDYDTTHLLRLIEAACALRDHKNDAKGWPGRWDELCVELEFIEARQQA